MTNLKAAVIDFQQALLKRRVAARFLQQGAEPKVDQKGSGDWVVYFETKSPKTIHRWRYPTKVKAEEVAEKTQREKGGFVTVLKNGIEVSSFPK